MWLSHLFENPKLGHWCFYSHFFSFLVIKYLDVKWRCLFFDQTFTYILLSFLLFDVWNALTTTPKNALELNTKCANDFYLFFDHWTFSQFLSAFSCVRSIMFILSLHRDVRRLRHCFKEDCIPLVTDFCWTNLLIVT